jgi:WD40 repeat protein
MQVTQEKIFPTCQRANPEQIKAVRFSFNFTSNVEAIFFHLTAGQKGLISCLSFSSTSLGTYAAGSYSKTVGIYSENSGRRISLIKNLGFGVTHIKWSPSAETIWIGGRKSSDLLCYDLRMLKTEVGRYLCMQLQG